jgi:outer membrane protein TolC
MDIMCATHKCQHWLLVVLLCYTTVSTGCMHGRQYYFCDDNRMAGYKSVATTLDEPDVDSCPLDEVRCAKRPITLENFEQHEFWDVKLETAVQMALGNSKVIRRIGAAGSVRTTGVVVPIIDSEGGSGSLLMTPDNVKTVYDPAVQETTVNALNQGVEAALSEFDARLSASMFWEKNDRPVNTNSPTLDPFNFQQDLGTFAAEISKTTAPGTRLSARHNVFYDLNNDPNREVPSDYTANFEIAARQPLARGAGVLFNRIAGPNSSIGVYNGVTISRINNDITLADFECNVRNMVFDLEKAYWELHFAYRALDAAKRGRDASLDYLRRVEASNEPAEVIAGARADYFRFRGQVEGLLSDLLQTERTLRYQMGLAATDCRLIRPIDEPTTAKIAFDWDEIHCEALARSCELRQQKWRIKQRELELIAARNWLLPQVDAVALYRWLGSGDDLTGKNGLPNTVPRYPGTSAYATLADGNFQEWQLGIQASMPIGFRKELSEVRNKQLQLARERGRLQDQELTVSHLLSDAVRQQEDWYHLMQTNYNTWIAARDRTKAIQAVVASGGKVDILNFREAIGSEANAETEYYRALINYTKEIPHVHFRKGSLLEYNNICLAEGPWPGKAYADARRRHVERAHAAPLNYAVTRPNVFSRGPIQQWWHDGCAAPHEVEGHEGAVQESPTPAEEVPMPAAPTTPPTSPTLAPPPVPGARPSVAPQPAKENTARRR